MSRSTSRSRSYSDNSFEIQESKCVEREKIRAQIKRIQKKRQKRGQNSDMPVPALKYYTEPHWAGLAPSCYFLTSGYEDVIPIFTFESFHLFGRGRKGVKYIDSPNFHEIWHSSVSKLHFVLQFSKNGNIWIENTSKNGTYVNGKQLPNRKYIEIKVGDKIQVGLDNEIYVVKVDYSRNRFGKTKRAHSREK